MGSDGHFRFFQRIRNSISSVAFAERPLADAKPQSARRKKEFLTAPFVSSILLALSPACLDRVAAIDGVFDFASSCRDWSVTVVIEEVNTWQNILDQSRFGGAILIANADDYHTASWLNDSRIVGRNSPMVAIGEGANGLATVKTDPKSIAIAAMEHFARASIQRLILVTQHSDDALWQSFQCMSKPANLAVQRWLIGNLPPLGIPIQAHSSHSLRQRFTEATKSALIASNPAIAIDLTKRATECGVPVPQDLSILSIRDSWQCGLPINSISAIVEPVREMGYQAARLLKRNLLHHPQVSPPVLLPIERIQLRQSCTQPLQFPEIAWAVEFIEKNALRGIAVTDVLQTQASSRVTFERHFREVMDCSPAELIRSVRLRHAKKLLTDTDLAIAEIAASCGFASTAKFSAFFRSGEGVSAREYRSSNSTS